MFKNVLIHRLTILMLAGGLLITMVLGLFYYFEERSDFERAQKRNEETTEGLEKKVEKEKERLQELPVNPFAPSGGKMFRQNPPRYVKKTINGFVTAVEGDRYLRITYPRGGETFCFGKPINISWESGGLKTITLSVREIGQGLGPSLATNTSYLGVYPASYNERGKDDGSGDVPWKVGNASNDDPSFFSFYVREGKVYDFIIQSVIDEGASDARVIDDTTDGVFSIVNCEG